MLKVWVEEAAVAAYNPAILQLVGTKAPMPRLAEATQTSSRIGPLSIRRHDP